MPHTDDLPLVLTLREVADVVRVDEEQVRALLAAGHLMALPGIAGEPRISRGSLERFLTGGRHDSRAPTTVVVKTSAQGPNGYVKMKNPGAGEDAPEYAVREDVARALGQAGLVPSGSARHGIRLERQGHPVFFMERIGPTGCTLYILPSRRWKKDPHNPSRLHPALLAERIRAHKLVPLAERITLDESERHMRITGVSWDELVQLIPGASLIFEGNS